MKPDINLYVIRSGGLPELQASWTRSARSHVAEALSKRLAAKKMEVISGSEIDDERPREPAAVQVERLHSAVVEAILASHTDRADRLPTKEKGFDWSLGSEAQILGDRYQADYALFVWFHENYPGSDLVATNVAPIPRLSALLSLYRKGYASLVDLKSGRIVWFAERDWQSPGVRTRRDSWTTINEMLESFPR